MLKICGAWLLLCLSACTYDDGGIEHRRSCGTTAIFGLILNVMTPGVAADESVQPVVVATDGSYSETLKMLPRMDGESYQTEGALERVGTYNVAAHAADFEDLTLTGLAVALGQGSCPHVMPVEETITFVPKNTGGN